MKKRLLSAVLALCLLGTTWPAYGAVMVAEPAADSTQPDASGLTEAIERVKTTLGIDSDVWDDFTYSSYQGVQGLRWSLSWGQSARPEEHLSADINGEGVLLSYYYAPAVSAEGLATVRQETARLAADDFLRRAAADYVQTLTMRPQESERQSGDAYAFVYQQSHEGIPVVNALVTVCVSKYTGQVTNYNVSESVNTANAHWPAADQAISAAKAQRALREEIGVRLVYQSRYAYDTGTYTVYPVYRLSRSGLVIDALTGQAVSSASAVSPLYAKDAAAEASGNTAARSVLSPKELAAVDNMAQLVSAQEAAHNLQQALGISGAAVTSSALHTTYSEKTRYIWRLDLSLASETQARIAGTVDAQTGQVLSFNYYDGSREPLASPATEAQAQQAQAALAARLAPAELAQCVAVPEDNTAQDESTTYVYRYERQVNGVAFPDNGLTIRYDAATGRIVSYQLSWNRSVTFPDVSQAKSVQAIIADMVKAADFRLLYQRDGQDYRLIYDFADKSALDFDPFSGERLNYQGKPYVPLLLPTYQWPAGVSENGVRLYENGVYLDGTRLDITAPLAQKELAVLLYRSRYPYAAVTDLQAVYDELAQWGVLPAGEAAPEAVVTREQASRIAARLLGYERLLDYPQLFAYPYSDAAGDDYRSSVAIAGTLGLLAADDAGAIRPTAAMTLGEGFDLLYMALRQ